MPNTPSPMAAFTRGPIAPALLKTALPIIFVMSMNGLLTVMDAIFLGHFVGARALSAVTLMFPASMLLAALSSLVASGMSSLLARHLGAGHEDAADAVFAGAHGLALCIGLLVIAAALLLGGPVALVAADGNHDVAGMAQIYLVVLALGAPVMLLLSVNADALRNEGGAMLMAGLSLLVSLANIAFNFVLIAVFDFGVAGSAAGTVMAQLLALGLVTWCRATGRARLAPVRLDPAALRSNWKTILALGAPQSLGLLGIALVSATVITVLQGLKADGYATTVAAYGVVTRIMTFTYLPLLGLSQALQTLIGHNAGAAEWRRSDAALRLGLGIAFGYCVLVQIVFSFGARSIGGLFVTEDDVIAEIGRILPMMTALYAVSGPLMMTAAYFQALGDARRAAVLSLAKPFLFYMPLLPLLPLWLGERGVWLAGPTADALLCLVAVVLLTCEARKGAARWGLFRG